MINAQYAKTILDMLFHTKAGDNSAEERQQLIDGGLNKFKLKDDNTTEYIGVSPAEYMFAFMIDDYNSNGEATRNLTDKKKLVAATNWYTTVDTPAQSFEYEVKKNPDDEADDTYIKKTVTMKGWYIQKRSEPIRKYPTSAFLALFTQMPDSTGANYQEPNMTNEMATTYMRVNLDEGILNGQRCLGDPQYNEGYGGTIMVNDSIIIYPEIYDVDWGSIVGFGIFDSEEIMSGDLIFWGHITNGPIDATIGHVPLFRKGDFQLTLA